MVLSLWFWTSPHIPMVYLLGSLQASRLFAIWSLWKFHFIDVLTLGSAGLSSIGSSQATQFTYLALISAAAALNR